MINNFKDFNNYLFELHKDFKDDVSCSVDPKELAEYLNSEIDRYKFNDKHKDDSKVKAKRNRTGVLFSKDMVNEFANNIEKLKDSIVTRPKKIFDRNEKMQKSDIGLNQITVNTGVPAIKGIIVDEDTGKFHYVNTCTGAGACMLLCYARKSFYIMKDEKIRELIQRLNFMMNDPDGYEKQILKELTPIAEEINAMSNYEPHELKIRWNDAGDFFSKKYYEIAKSVTKKLGKICKVQSYAYTKISDIYLNNTMKNFTFNFSTDSNSVEYNNVLGKIKKGAIHIPLSVFGKGQFFIGTTKDFKGRPFFKTKDSKEKLRKKIADYINNETDFSANIDRLVYTSELKRISPNSRNIYDVIVLPGDSDIAAQYKNVRLSLLLHH